jgi:hypothetical protein
MDFTSNIDYLILFLVSSLHEKFLWFGLTPNAYGISKLSLHLEKEMRMWKMWTHQEDNQIEGIIS